MSRRARAWLIGLLIMGLPGISLPGISPIAAELTRAHGGRLTASSEPGQGTRLTLTLPGGF